MTERYSGPISQMNLQQVEHELAELEEAKRWLGPSLDAEYAELGMEDGDAELIARIDEFERRQPELETRIAELKAASARLRARRRRR